jgi:hypothetical protein
MGARKDKRLALDESASLAPNDWSRIQVAMLECTDIAFRASSDIQLQVGAQVTLDVPGIGPTLAYVTWSRPEEFAATFAEPIDLNRARFMAVNQQVVLARLLKERAAAFSDGRKVEERALRRRILQSLPLDTFRMRVR